MNHPSLDPRWGQSQESFTYETFFHGLHSDFYLKKTVPQDIHSQWAVIKSLVELSYYQYEFMDLAVHKAFISLEMAMKFRHREITGSTWANNQTMNPLIKWFYKRGYFETDHEEYINRMVYIRNHFTHPNMHSFGGPFTAHNLFSPLHLINDLYEDRGLRKARNKKYDELQLLFTHINLYGGSLQWENGNKCVVYLINPTFINNKAGSEQFYLNYHSPFEIPVFKVGDPCNIYPALPLDCFDLKISRDLIKGKIKASGESFILLGLTDRTEQEHFTKWKEQYNTFAVATGHHLAIASPIYSRGYELITEFYKQDD
ncbi:MAG: hypothetical protein HYU70_16030 [Bacteroidetes bacterium]|nr:hypothetical protein [Bacteroidota bacterium]